MRSSPVCRAIALTPSPCRLNSKIITISLNRTTCAPFPWHQQGEFCASDDPGGMPPGSSAKAPNWGFFIQPFWGDYGQHSHPIAFRMAGMFRCTAARNAALAFSNRCQRSAT
ncbi:hypothetical protein E2978_20950 (plasmid) [Paracoccus yeei]